MKKLLRYREHVDRGIDTPVESNADLEDSGCIELGANHEEQHQELLLTDIKHAFFTSILCALSTCWPGFRGSASPAATPFTFESYDGGLIEAGHPGDSFCFDNELPRHRVA